ncbi:MAG: hypothetical protein HUU46_19695 [Candidatus Hydrogenedentes bacterium]|nr:hypothetical protein [Candidatus Hydrogenedentota bacterium]
MSRPRQITKAAAVSVCAAFLALVAAFRSGDANPVRVSDSTIDVGTVVAGSSFRAATTTIQNNSGHAIELLARWDCGCVRVEPSTFTLPKRGRIDLNVVVSPSVANDRISSNVYFTSPSTKTAVATLHITGKVAPLLQSDVQTLQLECDESKDVVERPLVIKNAHVANFDGRFRLTGAAGQYLDLDSQHLSVHAGETTRVRVRGRYPGDARVRGTLEVAQDSTGIAVLKVPIVLTGIPRVRVSPPTALFDGDSAVVALQLAKSDEAPFLLDDVKVDPPDRATVDWERDVRAQRHTVRLTVPPDRRRTGSTGTITISANADNETLTLSVPLLIGPK